MVETQWMLYTKKADFDAIGRAYGISPITARIIRNRDVVGDKAIRQYLNGTRNDLYSPELLPDMEEAVRILRSKVREGKHIRIVGDYDIDGVCSVYLLYTALRRVGAQADYEIPDRIKDGYGINESIIQAAYGDGVDTILTCDNGIAALEQIRLAKELGMTVIITDHHDIQTDGQGKDALPCADAVVNPKRQGCRYPYPEICGAMVAYKLVLALYRSWGVPDEEWLGLLEFAAIATVGDVMKLRDENRIVVKEGLRRLAKTDNIGLRKLIEKNQLDPAAITAYHVGFVIGPCLNAGGRLQTAKLALSLLLSQDEDEADRLSLELKELNDKRKSMTQEGVEMACAQVEQRYAGDKVLVVYLPDCHESLAGIVAGRLREAYQKPSFVLTKSEDCVKGSGRSIEAYHMFQALTRVKELLLKFGGHPMAAGFSLMEKDVDEFRRRLNEQSGLEDKDFIRKLWIDVPMPFSCIDEALIEELALLEPYGQGNEKPQFALLRQTIRSFRVMGKQRNAVKVSLSDDKGCLMDGVIFTDGDRFVQDMGDSRSMDIIYYPAVHEYNGARSLQINIKAWRFR